MKIKRVDILGFKSFHDKVSVDFQQGITGIVGPNGCGKSNVVDAIRWVMGEQSAKNLRGKQMEDIIFGGSESRKPLGMAEVSLVFSTDDGRVPTKYLNYSEIQVTRRLYRDGESEYLLNKSQCRLLDIAELFMDTGVGARAYSIIEQGKIGMILHSKPEERRALIEEAAGVTKFKARKQVALKKIELTRHNLTRITDIISEIKRQLGGLQRQAKKAERFRECREELKEIELLFCVKKYNALEREKHAADKQLSGLQETLAIQVAEQEKFELSYEVLRLSLVEHEEAIRQVQESLYSIKAEISGGENLCKFHKKELQNLEKVVDHAHRGKEDSALRYKQAHEELAVLHTRCSALAVETQQEELLLTERGGHLDESLIIEGSMSIQIDKMRNDLFQVISENSLLSNKQASAIKRLDMLSEKVDRNQRDIINLEERKIELRLEIERLEGACTEISAVKRLGHQEQEDFFRLEHELRASLTAVEAEIQEKRNLLVAKSSRLKSLQELETQFAGYGQGVRTLMSSKDHKSLFSGMVADMVETQEAFENALEAALGERVQWLICNDDEDAMKAVAYLKETGGGRCSFILQKAPQRPQQNVPDTVSLLQNVSIGETFRVHLEPLFADTFLVANLSHALSLGRQFPAQMFVTADGDLVHSGCIISGGSPEGAHQGLIHKKREIKELAEATTLCAREIDDLEEKRFRLKGQCLELEEALRSLGQRMHQADIDLLNSEKDLVRFQEEFCRLEERTTVSTIENEQLLEEKHQLESEILELKAKAGVEVEQKLVLERNLTQLQQALTAHREIIFEEREAVTGIKVKVAALKEKNDAASQNVKRLESLLIDLQQQMTKLDEEVERSSSDREKLLAAIAQSEESLTTLVKKLTAMEASYTAQKDEYDNQMKSHFADELRLKQLREQVMATKELLSTCTLDATQLVMQLNQLSTQVQDKYRLDMPELLSQYSAWEYDEAEKNVRQIELRKIIDDIGDVNLTAIEEFQELEKRFLFLDEQKKDLEESLLSLQKAIQRINKTTRKRFLETFQLVNEKFQEVFPRLFCGGRAELKLTNEDDLLESGLEIIVQPPGKKLQNVTLLSGGEKALSAVALIFSLFLIKPTPFCLLDEVDAPLDDANIGRFNDMVREMSVFSQFIIITHNKTTMAVVDTLYGVTMEEPGVSKLVSVRLN